MILPAIHQIRILTFLLLASGSLPALALEQYALKNRKIEVVFDSYGNLITLKNNETGKNYASGKPMWRLFFDTRREKGIVVSTKENQPAVTREGDSYVLKYERLNARDQKLNIGLILRISLEDDLVRFGSEVVNHEAHTIVREIQYPLVAGCRISDDQQLLTTTLGGQLIANPRKRINEVGNNPPYMAPAQFFRQMDLKYPSTTAANCFAFTGKREGLYFGCHDTTFTETWHGLRLYPDEMGDFTELEAGLYKYPNCLAGQAWRCDANVVAPYTGDWHQTSVLYRRWADTWWKKAAPPVWIQQMKSWQRIIFRHQYGETFFKYSDLQNRIYNVGESIGEKTVFPFGWWDSGMDNGYPDSYFVTDPDQGGDEGWKNAIADFRKKGGKLLLYFNGKLIDTESDFYRNGPGKSICYKRNTGMDYTEAYLFKAHDTFTGFYNSRSFVVGDIQSAEWKEMLFRYADRALHFGADAVFYDQLGYLYGDQNWDTSGEFPVPNRVGILDRANILKTIHEYLDAKDKNVGIGAEGVTDVTAQYVDFVHNLPAQSSYNFIEWVRFTFPEIIISDREIRDDTDVERRVNLTLLKGLRNDIEIYRCRDLIDKTPNYQRYLARINQVKEKYKSLLLEGTFRDTEGFTLDNSLLNAKCFVNGNRMAVAATQHGSKSLSGKLTVPGYRYVESSVVGEGTVQVDGKSGMKITLKNDALAVLIFEKSGN